MNRTVFYMVAAFGLLVGSAVGFGIGIRYGHTTTISPICHHPLGTDHHTTFAPDEQHT